ncbi:MAG TPA: M28 family metallopeptidase [Kofleriaceae bacterium]|nr:M28 family metallopeptidase [Kofleriaceae bacterium]
MTPGSLAALLIALSAIACGGDDDDGGDGGDGAGEADAAGGGAPDGGEPSPDAAADCLLADGCPEWLDEYLREVVGALSGETPIEGRVSLSARATAPQRDLTRAFLAAELERHGLEPQTDEYGGGANVFAELPATGAGKSLVVLGAHLDSVDGCPGAADDGTGVALVLAAARYLSGLDQRDHTVVFAFFDQEELGLLGSQAFAGRLMIEAVPVVAMHNFDMISWDDDDDRGVELWLPPAELQSPDLESLYLDAADELGIPVASHEFLSSDHAAFVGSGFDAIGMGEEYHEGDTTPHYHQPSDTFDKVDFDFLASSARLALRAVERQLGR